LTLPDRCVIQADALAWMEASPPSPRMSVVTSLPDISEMPERSLDRWRAWFIDAARRVIRWIPPAGAAIFYQTDVRHHGLWIDKGYLVLKAAEEESAALLWHKIACRLPPGTVTHGRASYSHMLCVARALHPPRHPGPDVLDGVGAMTWSKAMGVDACRVACRYLLDDTATRIVVDPFCGHGTVLAVANSLGLSAVGIDINAKRCRTARKLSLE